MSEIKKIRDTFPDFFYLIINFLNTDIENDKDNGVDKDNNDDINNDSEDKKERLINKLGSN